jgi:hypothetical protein
VNRFTKEQELLSGFVCHAFLCRIKARSSKRFQHNRSFARVFRRFSQAPPLAHPLARLHLHHQGALIMAKPLGAKTRIIRAAIAAHPTMSNKPLAEMLNNSLDRIEDKLEFSAMDIAGQRQVMKKPGAEKVEAATPLAATPAATGSVAEKPKPAGKKRGRPKGSVNATKKTAARITPPAAKAPARQMGAVDLIENVCNLAEQVGGMDQFKRLVDRLAGR